MDMFYNENIVGQCVGRFRCQRGWTQEELAVKMQLLGCYMTRDMIAKIESCHLYITDKQIMYFAEVFDVEADELFPQNRPDELN